jgi:hypothetical protein
MSKSAEEGQCEYSNEDNTYPHYWCYIQPLRVLGVGFVSGAADCLGLSYCSGQQVGLSVHYSREVAINRRDFLSSNAVRDVSGRFSAKNGCQWIDIH